MDLKHRTPEGQSPLEGLSGIDIVDAIRACFIVAASTPLVFYSIPFLNSRFVNYGPRATGTSRNSATSNRNATAQSSKSPVTSVLDYLASWQVPHRYFQHYYILALLSSAFWVTQLSTRGPGFRAVVGHMNHDRLEKSMSIHRVMVCVALMLIQGGRRLYETIEFAKPSNSKMWVVHWLLGLVFYAGITIAVWIEGAGSILSTNLTLDDVRVTTIPSLRTLLCVSVFLMASGIQHDCHHYLWSLKTYTIPSHPLFSWIICPHYTAECVIYLSLAFLAAPKGQLVNKTVLCGLAFVVVNLGITARNSQRWYKEKFGEDSVRGKWKMVPGVY